MVPSVASHAGDEECWSDPLPMAHPGPSCPGYPSVVGALEDTGTDAADVAPAEERILRAMMAALAALDPAALTIKRVCAAARVTPPTVYYHFGNKDGLVAAAVERLVAEWRYGMIHVDRDNDGNGTLARTKKRSFAWYTKVIESNGEIV